jgi:hypothetical protein
VIEFPCYFHFAAASACPAGPPLLFGSLGNSLQLTLRRSGLLGGHNHAVDGSPQLSRSLKASPAILRFVCLGSHVKIESQTNETY